MLSHMLLLITWCVGTRNVVCVNFKVGKLKNGSTYAECYAKRVGGKSIIPPRISMHMKAAYGGYNLVQPVGPSTRLQSAQLLGSGNTLHNRFSAEPKNYSVLNPCHCARARSKQCKRHLCHLVLVCTAMCNEKNRPDESSRTQTINPTAADGLYHRYVERWSGPVWCIGWFSRVLRNLCVVT